MAESAGNVRSSQRYSGSDSGSREQGTFSADTKDATCRQALARMMGAADEKNVVYTSCATAGLNIGLLGFPWEPKDVVLTTAAEHNAVLRPLYLLQKPGDFIIRLCRWKKTEDFPARFCTPI